MIVTLLMLLAFKNIFCLEYQKLKKKFIARNYKT